MITIQLTKTEPAIAPSHPHVWPLRVHATATGCDSEVFVYAAGDPSGDTFECVASAVQMSELPKTGAAKIEENLQIPFFRKSNLEFVCRSASERAGLWAKIQHHVQLLVDNLNAVEAASGIPDVVSLSSIIQAAATVNNVFTLSCFPIGEITHNAGEQAITYPPVSNALELFYSDTVALFPSAVPQVENDFAFSTAGWLPIAALPVAKITQVVPVTAKFWLNLAAYPKLRARLVGPFDRHTLVLNGSVLPYGSAYQITTDAIYWLDFPPASIPGFPTTGNAPWATNYSSFDNAGTAMQLQLTLRT